jgi:hypothetical protein
MNINRDITAYEEFRGFAPDDIAEERLPDNDISGWHMGDVNAIEYDTVRDGEEQYYRHEFKKKARPSLVAAENGGQLYLTGGDYGVTDRGIEDFKMPALLIANPHKRGTQGKQVARKGNPMRQSRRRRAAPRTVIVRANPIRRRRRANPSRRRRSASHAPVVVVRSNPVAPLRRRRRKLYARNPVVKTRHHVRRRRNPIFGGRGALDIGSLLMPALVQGSGAVATSILVGYLPIPDNFKTGSAAGATKAVAGLAAGWLIAKFVNKAAGKQFAEGALTIAVYDVVKGLAQQASMPMSGMGAMYRPGLGAMYHPGLGGMGFTTAASVTDQAYGYGTYAR